MADIIVCSNDEQPHCEKCGCRCDAVETGDKDDDGLIYRSTCPNDKCKHTFLVQFEDEEEREITGE